MQYFYTARFMRSLKKCESGIVDDVIGAISLFEKGESDKALKLHKLKGKMKRYQAFSVNFSYRVIIKVEKDSTYYMDIGTHDVYK